MTHLALTRVRALRRSRAAHLEARRVEQERQALGEPLHRLLEEHGALRREPPQPPALAQVFEAAP